MNKLLIALGLIGFCQAYWSDWKLPHKKIISPITAMSSSKIFGIGNGKLQEYYYNGGWTCRSHKKPNWNANMATVKPCVLNEKVFVISTNGELYERVYQGTWSWASHGKPSGPGNHQVSVSSVSGCASISLGPDRVMVVGSDSQLHERFYDNGKGQWEWRSHQHLPSTHIVSIDTAGLSVYAVGANRKLYRKEFNSWIFMMDKVVQVSGPNVEGSIFITTVNNEICEYDAATFLINCVTFDEFSSTSPPIRISKSIPIVECPGLTSGTYLAVHSAESSVYNQLNIIRFTGSLNKAVVLSRRRSKGFRGSPELIKNGNCVKVFSIHEDGEIRDTAWV